MIRRKVLERILDERLAPVVDQVELVRTNLAEFHREATFNTAAKVADAEKRVTAATEQAAATVRDAEARHADTLAGVRAELAEARGNTIRGALADLHRERETIARSYRKATVERDEARGQVAHLEAEVERLDAAWRARGEQLVAVEAQAAEAEQRAEVLEIERDEARRQHDEQRARADELDRWKAEALEALRMWEQVYEALGSPGPLGEWKASNTLAAVRALADAARAVLPDLAHGLPSQPKGGSRTRAKARMEALAALVTPTETTTNQEEPA